MFRQSFVEIVVSSKKLIKKGEFSISTNVY